MYSLVCFVQDYGNTDDNQYSVALENSCILENYADIQMTRNFLWSLANSKFTTKKDLTISDCGFLADLYFKRLETQRKELGGSEILDTDNYLTNINYLKQSFVSFASAIFQEPFLFEQYPCEDMHLFDAFTEQEKSYYNDLYQGIAKFEELKNEKMDLNLKMDSLYLKK